MVLQTHLDYADRADLKVGSCTQLEHALAWPRHSGAAGAAIEGVTMSLTRQIRLAVGLWVMLVGLPSVAMAQSAIAGQVKDTSGAVLPGVTVEAASPSLIEKTRSAVTDAQGLYRIIDLRPGAYSVTFSLAGFATIVRAGIDLPSNFTATINAELKVGDLAETLTVTGQAPTVDTRTSSTTQIISRELVDAVPTAHDFRGLGATVPGVKPNIQNVGGTRALSPQILTVHGSDSRDTASLVDGFIMNSMMGDDNIHLYHNDALVQEINYQTSAIPAEYSKGGVVINITPRDGGNDFHGQWYSNYASSSWQADNLTDDLIKKGLKSQNRNGGLYDINPYLAGPVMKNRLWFVASYRDVYVKEIVASTFYPDGSPGYQQSHTRNASARFTFQATTNNKITVHADKQFKRLPHILTAGQDPETGGVQRFPRDYIAALAKWTATGGSRWLFETGWGTNHETYFSDYLPGVGETRGSPAWFAKASRFDSVLNTRTTAGSNITGDYPTNDVISHSTSYVTGSHNVKVGTQLRYGTYRHTDDGNADLIQNYLNGVPDTVGIRNTPTVQTEEWNADWGIFAQDSWVLRRMTLNYGIRWEYFNAGIPAQDAPAGRFVPARHFDAISNLPNWKDWSPRFGVVYDLFGNGKTALKFGANRYNQGQAVGFAKLYNPMALQVDTRTWRDTNGDNIAQEAEIGPSNNVLFGKAPARLPDPNYKREYNREYSAIVQHQLFDRIGLTGGWFHRRFYNLGNSINVLVDANADYTSFSVPNPLTPAESITVYNLNRNKQGLVSLVDRNSEINSNVYDGIEISFTARFDRMNLYGGWTGNRTVAVTCDTNNPNGYRFCDQQGELYQSNGTTASIPFRHDFKLNGFYRLPWQMQANFAWQNYGGAASSINYPVPAALFAVVGGRTAAVTIPLVSPGVRYLERWNQLDIGVKKGITVGKTEISINLDLFNALNVSSILGEIQTFGPSLGQPTEILQGRFARIATTVKF